MYGMTHGSSCLHPLVSHVLSQVGLLQSPAPTSRVVSGPEVLRCPTKSYEVDLRQRHGQCWGDGTGGTGEGDSDSWTCPAGESGCPRPQGGFGARSPTRRTFVLMMGRPRRAVDHGWVAPLYNSPHCVCFSGAPVAPLLSFPWPNPRQAGVSGKPPPRVHHSPRGHHGPATDSRAARKLRWTVQCHRGGKGGSAGRALRPCPGRSLRLPRGRRAVRLAPGCAAGGAGVAFKGPCRQQTDHPVQDGVETQRRHDGASGNAAGSSARRRDDAPSSCCGVCMPCVCTKILQSSTVP